MSTLKTLLTAAALGATAYSRVLGQKVSAAENPPSKRGTRPSRRTKALAPDVAAAQQQLDTLQWVIPALTGALVAVSSYAGEQQRPSEVARGLGATSPCRPHHSRPLTRRAHDTGPTSERHVRRRPRRPTVRRPRRHPLPRLHRRAGQAPPGAAGFVAERCTAGRACCSPGGSASSSWDCCSCCSAWP